MKTLITITILCIQFIAHSQSIKGRWETYDDKTNEKKAIVEIYEKDNLFFAKIVKNFVKPADALCTKCEGDKKNQLLLGLVIIENIEKNDDEYDSGTILDPASGEVYKCYLKLIESNKLKVRGFIGFSLIGRTQYWLRKK